MSVIHITKTDGSVEVFDREKLIRSLHRSGADPDTAEQIANDVEKKLENGMTTNHIYTLAHAQLRAISHGTAARYSLKRAVQELGPTGFPFEAYLAEIFRAEGKKAEIDQIIEGGCVSHEVDVVIHEPGYKIYTEAKFHNAPGFKTDVKVTLYVHARIEDIRVKDPTARGLIVTNTGFTSQALQYAQCKLLDLLSWDYPENHSLHERIRATGMYPVTALTTLSKHEKDSLLNEKVVLCNTLHEHTDALERARVKASRAAKIFEEAAALSLSKENM